MIVRTIGPLPPSMTFLHTASSNFRITREETMSATARIGHAAYKGPSVVKEILIGISLGLMAGGLWKMHHWNNQRRSREFYDMLEKGEISVVVDEE